ncbi:MAG: hypothetical protein AAF916_08900 [Planctomycetota bacterium]
MIQDSPDDRTKMEQLHEARQAEERAKLNETLRPVREAFRRSGMTEDEAVQLFEQERDQALRERLQNAARDADSGATVDPDELLWHLKRRGTRA